MNWQHFKTFSWLRWRLRANQLKRSGLGNKVVLMLLSVAVVLLTFVLFAASFTVGLLALSEASPEVIMFVWDGVVLAMLFFWTAGVMTELQRSEVLSLDKFLHLPVSLSSEFVVNYLSSLFDLNMLLFVPAMVGLSLGLAVGRGPAMLLLLPALAALLLMVTAVTHQFQGWLASLMVNKRRRQTIIMVVTIAFVLIAQGPNLFNQLVFSHRPNPLQKSLVDGRAEVARALAANEISHTEYEQRLQDLKRDYETQTEEIDRQNWERVGHGIALASLFLPPAWLPLGAMDVADGRIWPSLLGTLGMTLIGMTCLWRSYHTTLRLYTGQFTSGGRRPVAAVPSTVSALQAASPAAHLLEKRLPWISERASAVALGSFRSLLPRPEIKMLLLSPVFMVIVMGPMIMRGGNVPEPVRPLLGFGAMAFILWAMIGLVGNQFGIDRSGFQVFMLCGAPRADILLGKNLAAAPFALGMGVVVALAMQIILPARLSYFLAVPSELISMYLVFCLLANWLSIHAPVNVPAGALRRAKPSGMAMVLHLSFMFVVFPLTMMPMLMPLGAQALLERQGWSAGFPLCLLLSLAECAAVVFVYRYVVRWEGGLLQAREQAIYAVVRTKEE